MVLAGLQELGDVEAVGRMPERARGLAVDGDQGSFADGRVEVSVHAGAGTGDRGLGSPLAPRTACSGGEFGAPGRGFPPSTSR